MQQAMSGPGKDESLEATKAEIDKLEHVNTRNMKKRSQIPNGSNMISNIWDLKIKKHLEKRLENSKADSVKSTRVPDSPINFRRVTQEL